MTLRIRKATRVLAGTCFILGACAAGNGISHSGAFARHVSVVGRARALERKHDLPRTPQAGLGGLRFLFVGTEPVDSQSFTWYLSTCAREAAPLQRFLLEREGRAALRVHVSRNNPALFGMPLDPQTNESLLTLDLADLEALPLPEEVRTWGRDSGWAYSRCEILAHELVEAVHFQDVITGMARASTMPDSAARRGDLRADTRPHSMALLFEEEVARSIRVRPVVDGKAARSHNCFQGSSIIVALGHNAEVLVTRRNDVSQVLYFRETDLCGLL